MPLLPCLGETEATENWTPVQIWSFAVCTYLMIIIFFLTWLLAVKNLNQFIVQSAKTRKTKCHPMFIYYLWIMLDLLSNIVWLLMNIRSENTAQPMITYLPAAFKILLGIEQIWLMIELIAQTYMAD